MLRGTLAASARSASIPDGEVDLLGPGSPSPNEFLDSDVEVDRKPAARSVAAPVIMLSGVIRNGSWNPASLMILLQRARRASRGRVELEE